MRRQRAQRSRPGKPPMDCRPPNSGPKAGRRTERTLPRSPVAPTASDTDYGLTHVSTIHGATDMRAVIPGPPRPVLGTRVGAQPPMPESAAHFLMSFASALRIQPFFTARLSALLYFATNALCVG